jgi:DNA-binding response OmpR family regulator
VPRPPDYLPVVAVINTNDDIVEMLRMAFEQAGMVVVSAHVDDIRRGDMSLRDFVLEHSPSVVVYDITPPYERSYRFLQHVRESEGLKNARFVLTSTNPQRVHELTGTAEEVFEILGKPYDLEVITRAVKEASRARPTR